MSRAAIQLVRLPAVEPAAAHDGLDVFRRRLRARHVHCSSHARVSETNAWASPYTCSIDAEPLERYRKGGYHPIRIGDLVHNGRYRIVHKLGWGGYSTVWAARDQRLAKASASHENFAIKIAVSEQHKPVRELIALTTLAELKPGHPGVDHILPLVDHFQIEGPNGKHECLVIDIVGPKVPDVTEQLCGGKGLPGGLAKCVAKQVLSALDCLHRFGIAHGNLHTGNFAFSIPSVRSLPERELLQQLGDPDTAPVYRQDGKQCQKSVPEYLVRPTSWPLSRALQSAPIKLIDFGEAFSENEPPSTLHTPLVVRSPEAIFNDRLTVKSDLWSMGCALFELYTGQPPFDSIMITPPLLVSQMLGSTQDVLPERWEAAWQAMRPPPADVEDCLSLQELLEEIYFDDGNLRKDLSRDDIRELGRLIKLMLRLEPAARASAREILESPWFRDA
ncbi:kinase-like protein [Teratosphaeria nubilosa]|uniref:non-specific serine/threonine protein kinase n=1 Tax=Teratosphaeria nubilosa TaxID=161662 RepID=A0A6G1L1U8_9PEZI|nr:kinase-like protein [Teratosphaeria nubilosa]